MSPAEAAHEIILYLEQQGWLTPGGADDQGRVGAEGGAAAAAAVSADPSPQAR
jgi:hypothetical protein